MVQVRLRGECDCQSQAAFRGRPFTGTFEKFLACIRIFDLRHCLRQKCPFFVYAGLRQEYFLSTLLSTPVYAQSE